MEDLGEYLEKQIALRSKITSAMVYPIFIISVMGIVVWVLLSFVVPKIAQLLEDVGKSLPIYTRLLITFSKIFSATAPYFLLGSVILFLLRKKILSIPKIRYNFDLLRLKIPIYSKIHILGETYRIFSTLATLTRAGVPLVKAIETAEEISTNVHIKKVLRESKEYAIEGRNISERFAESDIFPPMIANMIAVGERSGEIEKMFWNISQITSSELETFLSGVTSLIEPILILSIGAMIFFIMLSVIVPILEINRSIM
jgi:general secretion pathway protein F